MAKLELSETQFRDLMSRSDYVMMRNSKNELYRFWMDGLFVYLDHLDKSHKIPRKKVYFSHFLHNFDSETGEFNVLDGLKFVTVTVNKGD